MDKISIKEWTAMIAVICFIMFVIYPKVSEVMPILSVEGIRDNFKKFSRKQRLNRKEWHVYRPIFRVRLTNGSRSERLGTIWRRQTDRGGWEYFQDAETLEEWADRQW